MNDLRRRATLVAVAAPLLAGILGSQPAAADDPPGPLAIAVSPDGCSVVGTGTGYDELELLVFDSSSIRTADVDTDGQVEAAYGTDYLAAVGDSIKVRLEGSVAGQVVETTETTFVPTCDAGSVVTLDITTVGTPPDPAATFAVTIHDCAEYDGLTAEVGVTDGGTYAVPVPLGPWCVRLYNIPDGLHAWGTTPDEVVLVDAAGEHVEVLLDFASRHLTLEARFRNADGQLVDAGSVGVDPLAVVFEAASFDDGGQPIGTGGPCTFDGEPDVECDGTDVLGMRPNGSATVTGGVDGWFLEQTTFVESDCTEPFPSTCLLSLVLAAIPQSSPAPPQGDAVPDPEPVVGPEPDQPPTTTTSTTATTTPAPPAPATAPGDAPLSSFGAIEVAAAAGTAATPAPAPDGDETVERRALPRTGWAAGPLAAGGVGSIAVGWALRMLGAQMALRRSRRSASTAAA